MKITSVSNDKKNKGSVILHFDDDSTLTVSEEDYIRLSLYEKQELSQDELKSILENIDFNRAKSSALKYQLYRFRSSKEVRQKLEREGYDEVIIEKVLDELIKLGYINDRLYASKYLHDRSKLKPKPKRVLKQELINKGIDEKIIEELLEEWKIDEYALAESMLKKKYGKYDMNDIKIKRKAYAYLLHKGFENELVLSLINKLSQDNNDYIGG